MPTTPSPLRYPGGKHAYAEMLAQIIQKNGLKGCAYAEPFAGGAGAAIALLLNKTVSEILINDFDPAIYAFWFSILNHTETFLEILRSTPVTITEWKKQKNLYQNQDSSLLLLGFATFFLNRCNHAGILAANPIGGLGQSSNYRIDARFKKEKLAAKIRAIAELRNAIHLTGMDALDFIALLKQSKRKDVLVYFDPPYYQKGELLYLNFYRHEDHVKLSQAIQTCGRPWLLSYDNRPEILDLYQTMRMYRRSLRYSISKPSSEWELVISNLEMPKYLEAV